MIAAPRDHARRPLPARDLNPFANCLLGADSTKAVATVHDRGRRTCTLDRQRCVNDDRAVGHEPEVLRNPDHSV
jgi:hypothetical protein